MVAVTSAWSSAGRSAALPAAGPEMADQCWKKAALSGEGREVYTPGSRGGEACALSGSATASRASSVTAIRASSESVCS